MIHAVDNGCKTANATCKTPSNPGAELWAFVPSLFKTLNILLPLKNTQNLTLMQQALLLLLLMILNFQQGEIRINNEFMRYTGKTSTTLPVSQEDMIVQATHHMMMQLHIHQMILSMMKQRQT